MPDFLCYYVQKRNIKHNFEKNRLNLLNIRRKINKEEKTKLFVQYEKQERKVCGLW